MRTGQGSATTTADSDRVRVDKWLWAARFFKTRSLATEAVDGGRVHVNGLRAKPSRDLRVGDRVELSVGEQHWTLTVLALAERRGPAELARSLYQESEASAQARQAARDLRRFSAEPAAGAIGRPTKRDRRELERLRRAPGVKAQPD